MGGYHPLNEAEGTTRAYRIILMCGIIFASFNLRPAISSVGPLIGLIKEDYQLENWEAGFLTTLPLIAFALLSPLVSQFGARFTNEVAVLAGMILLVLGMFVRSTPLVAMLFIGTLIAGAGIAVLNVLIPAIIKHKFPLKVGLMTGVYSTTMGVVAGTASGVSIPFATRWGWRMSLLFWVIPALIGVFFWAYIARKERRKQKDASRSKRNLESSKPAFASNKRIWSSPLAWQMAMFMALQSFIFYVTLSWLPTILESRGYSPSGAGWMLSFMQLIGLPASFLIPVLAGRLKSQRGIVVGLCTGMFFGFTTLLIGTSPAMMTAGTAVIGLSVNGNFALALTFFGLRARNVSDASALSGMAQSLGYLFSALGPVLIGLLFDVTGTWKWPIATQLMAVGLLLVFGLFVGQDRHVFDEKKTLVRN